MRRKIDKQINSYLWKGGGKGKLGFIRGSEINDHFSFSIVLKLFSKILFFKHQYYYLYYHYYFCYYFYQEETFGCSHTTHPTFVVLQQSFGTIIIKIIMINNIKNK